MLSHLGPIGTAISEPVIQWSTPPRVTVKYYEAGKNPRTLNGNTLLVCDTSSKSVISKEYLFHSFIRVSI